MQEILSAIGSQRRPDESILLEDLLKFEESQVYKLSNIKHKGTFATEFAKYVPKGIASRGDTNQIDYYTFAESNITIYFPYSENYVFSSLTQDNISLAAASSNANQGPGERPTRVNATTVTYLAVTVDDDYADIHPTHIVGVVNEKQLRILCPDPNDPDCNPPPQQPLSKRIYIGKTVLRVHFDKLISFDGNGGGSEIKVCHLTGYLQPVGGQVTTFQDIVHINFSRREIRRRTEKRVFNIWDDDWQFNDREQVLGVYEEDNTSEITFGGSLTTTLTPNPTQGGVGVTGTISYSVKRSSQDEIIKQLKISRLSYFTFAKTDQGWGFDSEFIWTSTWPKIDWQPTFGYTMPYQQL